MPLDGSELAASVLPFAADLAKSLRAWVVLFHAVVEPVMTYPGTEAIFDATARLEMETGARKSLTSVASDLAAQGLKADILTNFGHATDAILWAAERESAGAIVMSTHGRSGLGRMVLGSVADSVVRRTSQPVIVVRPAISEEVSR